MKFHVDGRKLCESAVFVRHSIVVVDENKLQDISTNKPLTKPTTLSLSLASVYGLYHNTYILHKQLIPCFFSVSVSEKESQQRVEKTGVASKLRQSWQHHNPPPPPRTVRSIIWIPTVPAMCRTALRQRRSGISNALRWCGPTTTTTPQDRHGHTD